MGLKDIICRKLSIDAEDLLHLLFNCTWRKGIEDLKRMALCTPRWPDIETRSTNKNAKRKLRKVMIGIKLLLDRL